MPRWFILLAALTLAHGSARAQAVAPLPEPVIETAPTGWRDGSAVPAGAGLVTPMTPMEEPLAVPRSPDKRVLPHSSEPGIWAAGGDVIDPRKSGLLGLPLPLAPDMMTLPGMTKTRRCGDSMNAVLREAGLYERAMALPVDIRNCLAAQLFRMCALGYEAAARDGAKTDSTKKPHHRQYQRMVEAADAWLDEACKSPRSTEAETLFSRAASEWWKRGPEVK